MGGREKRGGGGIEAWSISYFVSTAVEERVGW